MMNEDISSPSTSSSGGSGGVKKFFIRLSQTYQSTLDRSTPHTQMRWVFAGFVLLLFVLRIFLYQGWYIICYALGIYHLNLFIAFLTPKIDPEFDPYAQDEEDEGPNLPTRSNEEFRPFIRRLPEFKFWLSVTKSTAIGLFCTFFDFFNVPVFWPILVMYFITLFCITMKRQIKHMIKYKYLPFTRNKPRYQRVNESAGAASLGGNSK
ncbi:protein RER1 [Drosophila busckii]|uniref:protein RER1 n=1 Tax=Drosophila busckii TaxID=30019 RepID=UPI00083EE409|nr:protein RER1 [Drosophila busckii]